MLNAIVVDDDQLSAEILRDMVIDHCKQVNIVDVVDSAKAARASIKEHSPQLVFLDIEMPQEDGLEFISSFDERNFQVIFVSGHAQYAIDAFKHSAQYYLHKPVDPNELKKAVSKVGQRADELEKDGFEKYRDEVKHLVKEIIGGTGNARITLHHSKGFKIVDEDEIISLEADGNYTTVFLADEKIVVSRALKEFEDILNRDTFFRAHRSHLINLKHLKAFSTEDGGLAIMDNDSQIDISRRKLQEFYERVEKISLSLKK